MIGGRGADAFSTICYNDKWKVSGNNAFVQSGEGVNKGWKLRSYPKESLPETETFLFLIQNVAEALNDVMKPEDNNSYVDSLLLSSSSSSNTSGYNEDDADYYTEHDTRKRDLSLNDIVHKVSLNEYFQSKLQGWSQFVGETTYVNTLGNLDVETRDTLKEYITL